MPTRCTMPFENFRSCSRRSAPMPTRSSEASTRAAAIGGGVAEQLAKYVEQLLGGQVVVEVGVFGKVADALARRDVADGLAENLGAARRRENELHQQLQRRRLARAVRSEKAEHLARLDRERQPIERAVRPLPPEADRVVLRQLVDSVSLGACGVSRGGHVRRYLALCSSSWIRSVESTGPDSTCSSLRPLMKKVGVELDAEQLAEASVGLDFFLRARVLRVEVGDAADGSRRILDLVAA